MANTKKLITLGAALLVVIALIVAVESLGKKPMSTKATAFFPGITTSSVSAVQIIDNQEMVKVARIGERWVVEKLAAAPKKEGAIPDAGNDNSLSSASIQYPADSASVATMLEKLADMKKDVLVSKNPDKQQVFEVDSTHGILVEVWDAKGKSAGTLRIGKTGQDWSSNFVRAMGSNEVWLVGGSVRSAFFGDIKRWRDKTILSFDATAVKSITLTSQDTAAAAGKGVQAKTPEVKTVVTRLTKSVDSLQNETWTLVEPEKAPARKDEVEKLVTKLASLRTADWEEDAAALTDDITGFGAPRLVALVEFKNGDTRTVTFGKTNETSRVYVKADGKDETFLLSDSALQDFNKKAADLKDADQAPAQ